MHFNKHQIKIDNYSLFSSSLLKSNRHSDLTQKPKSLKYADRISGALTNLSSLFFTKMFCWYFENSPLYWTPKNFIKYPLPFCKRSWRSIWNVGILFVFLIGRYSNKNSMSYFLFLCSSQNFRRYFIRISRSEIWSLSWIYVRRTIQLSASVWTTAHFRIASCPVMVIHRRVW